MKLTVSRGSIVFQIFPAVCVHAVFLLSFERLFCLITAKSSDGETFLVRQVRLEGAESVSWQRSQTEKWWWFREEAELWELKSK